jgi:hypothetical protein
MSEQTPSQAEGEREPDTATDEEARTPGSDVPRTAPSQAEGEDFAEEEAAADGSGESGGS